MGRVAGLLGRTLERGGLWAVLARKRPLAQMARAGFDRAVAYGEGPRAARLAARPRRCARADVSA